MKKTVNALLLLVLVLFAYLPCAYAAAEDPAAVWNISFIGDMKVPAGFSAVEVKDFRAFVDQEKKTVSDSAKTKQPSTKPAKPATVPEGAPPLLKDAIPADQEAVMQRLSKSDFGLYHMTLDDGNAIHMAWFFAAQDGEKMLDAVNVFDKELTAEQTQKLDELKIWVDANIDKAQYNDPKKNVSLKLIEMLPIQVLPMKAGQMWTAGARALITAEDMPFAFFGRAYVLSLDGHLTVGVLVGFDGERPFWDPVIRNALTSLGTPLVAN